MRTELDDLQRPLDLPAGTIALDRDARLFATRRELAARLRREAVVVRMVPDELLHPQPPCDLVVRRGILRASELLADGREVTRAVLQAGAVCRVRAVADGAAADGTVGGTLASPLYNLANTVLMALAETELWHLPAGTLGPA
ncbi:MAG: hypothetical protein RBT60_05685 [Candidatus Krumholzibacteria bacterium]|nr:hypothetical protein [Candidatus Krumholzibacteria bacterium]